MNPDINTILTCGSLLDVASCANDNQCKWYKGKVVASNTGAMTAVKLYQDNFCHPATLDGWEVALPYCFKEMDE
jgi:hypothetical protein